MTRQQLKDAIRRGDPTPDIDQDLFEACYEEVLKEDHPNSQLVTLMESRSSDGLPAGVHERVAAMLGGRREQVRPLTEARSDLKDDGLFDPPGQDAATLGKLLRAAGDRYKAATDEATIKTRILTRDGRPKPWRFVPVTLTEAMAEAERLPKGIHGLIASRLPNRGGR